MALPSTHRRSRRLDVLGCRPSQLSTIAFIALALSGRTVIAAQIAPSRNPWPTGSSEIGGVSTTVASESASHWTFQKLGSDSHVVYTDASWDPSDQLIRLVGNLILIGAIGSCTYIFYQHFCQSEKKIFDKGRKICLLGLLALQYIYHRIEPDVRSPLGLSIG